MELEASTYLLAFGRRGLRGLAQRNPGGLRLRTSGPPALDLNPALGGINGGKAIRDTFDFEGITSTQLAGGSRRKFQDGADASRFTGMAFRQENITGDPGRPHDRRDSRPLGRVFIARHQIKQLDRPPRNLT